MKVIGLDEKEYAWKITRYNKPRDNCSTLHSRARNLLKQIFQYDNIYEEVILPGIKTEINNRPLIIDFYINAPKIAVEVQGEQHYNFVSFFHTNKLEYFRAKKLDALKHKWCNINNIRLVILPYNQSDEDWEKLIRNI
jgi:hypothetical protein